MKKTRLLLCSMAFALSACGGGGDRSDHMHLSPNRLEFAGIQGQDIAASAVDVYIGLSPERRFVDYVNRNPELVTVSIDIETFDEFELMIKPVAGLARGTYTGSVDALVCDDEDCDDIDDRGIIEYTITIN